MAHAVASDSEVLGMCLCGHHLFVPWLIGYAMPTHHPMPKLHTTHIRTYSKRVGISLSSYFKSLNYV
jgi:hypothetical protein